MADSTDSTLLNLPLPGSKEDPNTLHMLGFDLMSWDADAQRIRVAFDTQPEFRNPAGIIQGGILAAMLDDTFGPLIILASEFKEHPMTLDLNVSYLTAGQVGRFECEARIIRKGKSIAFVEGELFGADGVLVARATSTIRFASMPAGITPD